VRAQHNITRGVVEHALEHAKHARLSVIPAQHNIYYRMLGRHITPSSCSEGGTGVRIVDLHRQRLRKYSVQPPADRAQPLYPTVRLAPRLLDRSHLRFRHLSRQVQLPPVTEVDASPGHLSILRGEARG
jgi:hypothetical protein